MDLRVPHVRFLRPWTVAVSITLCASAGAAQNILLSGSRPARPVSEPMSFVLTPDGSHALFVADLSEPFDSHGLYAMPTDGSAPPVRLSTESGRLGAEEEFAIASDSRRVVFVVEASPRDELYSAPVDGSQPAVRLDGGGFLEFALGDDGSRVVYGALSGAYVVPIDGSSPPLLLGGAGKFVGAVRISPGGQRVVYTATSSGFPYHKDLFSVPSDGSAAPVRLNTGGSWVQVEDDFALSSDGLGVVYRADQDTDFLPELYAVRIDGSAAPVKRSGAMAPGSAGVEAFALSEVGERVAYRADQDTPDMLELYGVRVVTGGTPMKLNAPLPPGGDVQDFAFSPDATRVVYRSQPNLFNAPFAGPSPVVQLTASVAYPWIAGVHFAADRVLFGESSGTFLTLHSAPLDGSSAPVRLSPPRFFEYAAAFEDALPDGTVLYTANQDDANVRDLYGVPLDGGAGAVRVNDPTTTVGATRALGADRVLYLGRPTDELASWFFTAYVAGGAPLRLPGTPTAAEVGAAHLRVDRGAEHALFNVSHLLFGVPTDGRRQPRVLNERTRERDGGYVGTALISPDGEWAVFTDAGGPYSYPYRLLSAPTDGRREPILLSRPPETGVQEWVKNVQVTPDSRSLLYIDHHDELLLAPIDGSQPPSTLRTVTAAGEEISFYLVDPASARVLSALEDERLYIQPLAGGQPPVQLADKVQAYGGLVPQFTPAGDRVLLARRPLRLSGIHDELYSVPAAGGSPPIELSRTPVPASYDVRLFHVSADGNWVVFRAGNSDHSVEQIFSARCDGSSAAVLLNAPLPLGRSVGKFLISPDSTRVLYVSDENGADELFSVPIGGGTPVRLNGPLVSGGSVYTRADYYSRNFEISRAGRVVYRADQDTFMQYELYSVPLDGSAPAVRISGAMPPWGMAMEFVLTPDGEEVVFRADFRVNELFELFVVPIDGSAAPRVVSGPMVPGGDVVGSDTSGYSPGFHVGPGRRVIYLADQRQDGLDELFASFLSRPARGASTPTDTVVR